jgi:hypothetical protein
VVGAIAVLIALSGCGTDADRAHVRSVTTRFYAALDARHGADACNALTASLRKAIEQEQSNARCQDAVVQITTKSSPVKDVRVYATSARADLTGGESVFLSAMRAGWQIDALGCRPRPSGPYDCDERG